MSFIIAGDTHGTIDINKVVHFFNEHEGENTSNDYLIICGDVGVCGFSASEEAEVRNVLRSLPVTTLFVDGNHENFDLLNNNPVQQWHGGKVHRISDSIIHLMRGQVFEIDGKSFFTMGGAESHDKADRILGKSYWSNELPSESEYTEALRNLQNHGYKVDYIITHCATTALQKEIRNQIDGTAYKSDTLLKFFDELDMMMNYQKWFCGHYHIDLTSKSNSRIRVLFEDIVEV